MVVTLLVSDRVKTKILDLCVFHKIKSRDSTFPSFLWADVSFSLFSLPVLLCPPRFRAIVEMLKPERPDLSVTLKGLDYIDVLSGSKKDYKLNFFSHKEGLYSAKVSMHQRRDPGTPEI